MRINTLLFSLFVGLMLSGCVTVGNQQTQEEKASAINTELGIGYLQQENYQLASEKLIKALQYEPDSVRANYIYAILQDRLGETELAEYHYEKATELDPENSEAANNYGAFLCRNNREADSVKYFLRALDNPLYRTPEFAYTNAAICLLKIDRTEEAKTYLEKALTLRSDFGSALLVMADIAFEEGDHQVARSYLARHDQVSAPSAKSLWLNIRNQLELDADSNVDELAQMLETRFPDSDEYRAWLKIQ